MKILITGAIGNVGRAAVERLAQSGHEITVIGRRADMAIPPAEYRQCDITDFPRLDAAAKGMDAIVHLAALASPSHGTPEKVFEINCQGTFNVYQAAVNAGIRRVVSASSINALGRGFGIKECPVRYFPVDEEHPTYTTDAYSYSKTVVEDIAAYFWRREKISGTSLRIPAVVSEKSNGEDTIKPAVERCKKEADRILALPADERRQLLDGWNAIIEERQAALVHERSNHGWEGEWPDVQILGLRTDFWTAVDERDSAQSIEKSLLSDYEGSHVLFINDSHNRIGVESRALVELFYPDAPWKRPVEGTEALVSIAKARSLIGYEPEYSVSRFF
jgi:nucleoside-diphosphate-sugar epimerase